jgi:hypothetical protein
LYSRILLFKEYICKFHQYLKFSPSTEQSTVLLHPKDQLPQCMEIIAVFLQIVPTHNPLCGQIAELLVVKAGGT